MQLESARPHPETGGFRRGAHCVGLALLLLTAPLAAGPVTAGGYTLGAEDRIRVKVYEWRATENEVFEWEAVNDEYTIGAEGGLSLPLVGQVQAAGTTTEELALLVGLQLAERAGLGRRPSVAVEIVEYRPFYIMGQVAEPGAYPFRPGLTLLKAVSLAGGIDTGSEDGSSSTVARLGEIDVLLLQRDAAMARLARLQAALAGADDVEVPLKLLARAVEPSVARLIKQERAIFAAELDAFRTRMAALQQLHSDLMMDVPAQEALLETVKMQAESVREELEIVGGVVTGREVRGMEREIAKLDGDRLRAETSLLKAKQEVSRAEISIIELRTRRAEELAAGLRETQTQLDQLDRRIETAQLLIDEDGLTAAPGLTMLRPVFTILRADGDRTVELVGEETTPVEPGDTIKVERRRAHSSAASAETN